MKDFSRREFLKMAALGPAALVGGQVLSACGKEAAPGRATEQPEARDIPTQLPPAATQTPKLARLGRVVRARHSGVWREGALDGEILRQMLDASVSGLTGLDDAGQAWASLFKPGERVAIKVNALSNGSTHLALALAVTGRLQEAAGVRPERITLYDRSSRELEDSGFPVSKSGTGLQCSGTDWQFAQGWEIDGQAAGLSHILAECDALINLPILKGFSIGGLSFAMKNHYGSLDSPDRFHDNHFTPGVTGLNALEPIRGRTRLIIGDVLSEETHQDWTDYVVIGGANAILASFDPIAHDRIGLQMAGEALASSGLDLRRMESWALEWLEAGVKLGLGVNEIEEIDLREKVLE